MIEILHVMGSAAEGSALDTLDRITKEAQGIIEARSMLTKDKKPPPDVVDGVHRLVGMLTDEEVQRYADRFGGVRGDARLDAARLYNSLWWEFHNYIHSRLCFGRSSETVVEYWDRAARLPERLRAGFACQLLDPDEWYCYSKQCFEAIMFIEERGGDGAFTETHYAALEQRLARSYTNFRVSEHRSAANRKNSRFLSIVCAAAMRADSAEDALAAFTMCEKDPLLVPGANPTLRAAAEVFKRIYAGRKSKAKRRRA